MGTQQILLIVLSVIIVGAAIAVGIQMFNSQAYSANKSAIAADALTYATQIIQYYKTPTTQGGLGGDLSDEDVVSAIYAYLGWAFDGEEDSNNHKTDSGWFSVDVDGNEVTVTGIGTAQRGDNIPKIETTITFPGGNIDATPADNGSHTDLN